MQNSIEYVLEPNLAFKLLLHVVINNKTWIIVEYTTLIEKKYKNDGIK